MFADTLAPYVAEASAVMVLIMQGTGLVVLGIPASTSQVFTIHSIDNNNIL